ncbi:MAG: hypothetical protein M0Z49_05465 [Chloroflexi bacterium]|nr:hypothetical protein [Chloroflexota bacterium]
MSNLINEFAIRLVKPLVALLLGAALDWALVSFAGARSSVELAVLCWLGATAFILLVQESPL